MSEKFFHWIPELLRVSEADMLQCVGLDAVVLLRFFTMCIKLFLYCLIPGLLIILPVNHYSSRDGRDPSIPDDDKDPEDPNLGITSASLLYLFTQFTFTWVFSLLAIYIIWNTYEDYIQLRRKYMVDRAKYITNRSVMVVGLPPHLQTDRSLATFYESLNVGSVESAHVCRHVDRLKRLIEQRAHALKDLETAYAKYYGNPSDFPGYDPERIEADNDHYLNESHPAEDHTEDHDVNDNENSSLLPQVKKRPTMKLGFLGLFGEKVDKIDHYREVFATLDKAVIKMRTSRIFTNTTIGFVTFEEMHSAQILAQTVNTQETLSCDTFLAPEPRDVYWSNLSLPPSELGVRAVVINTTVFFLIFFWSIPIGAFSSFLNLDSLEKLLPGISKILEANPALKSVIQGFLPTLGVTVFLAVVPKILEVLCIQQGIRSHSGIDRSMYNKYFTFILFNVVLVLTVVGTWAQAFNKVYHNFGELSLLLAASLPRVSPFFVNYLILKGIGMLPLQLLELGDVFTLIFRSFLAKTPRDYAEARAPPMLDQGVVYSQATLTFVIVVIYSCIKPLVLLFGMIYFVLAYLVYKYQLLYVFYQPYESNGRTWPMVYNRLMIGLLIFQSTMLGLFMLNQSYLLGGLLVPLPIGTIWFWTWTTEQYTTSAEYIPLELLHSVDVTHPAPNNQNSTTVESSAQVPGHILINIDQNNGAQSKGSSNGTSVFNATDVITPGGTLRNIPKSRFEDDDYQAIPDRYTDYRQPPMTLYPGVLNCGMRQYSHPAVAGPLPTLWLPLQKSSGKKKDEESMINGLFPHHDSDSDSDDDEHHLHQTLARPSQVLPTRSSDVPQTYDEGDNLVGGGQDEDLSGVTSNQDNASTAAAPIRGPQGVPESLTTSASDPTIVAAAGDASASTSAAAAATGTDATPSRSSSKRHPAVDGVDDVYYHHPEKQSISRSSTRKRTVQGQGSTANLPTRQSNPVASSSDADAPK
ncbi:hypothetical protein BGZ49_009051 [Haplosporangium sp. Z 27]|nr:hypothetical protein BGZ49_009051 [Haplosporangium sp. Z 27]